MVPKISTTNLEILVVGAAEAIPVWPTENTDSDKAKKPKIFKTR